MTAVKKAASSLSPSFSGPIVAGLRHSVIRNASVPPAISTVLRPTVIRVSRDQRRGRRQVRSSSKTTGKPSPPTITASAIVTQIQGSVTYRIRLSGHRAKPALLNADTAWKAPR